MALVGGGTGGFANTVNPAGTGTSLNYIGNHCYAYSGVITPSGAASADTTALQFTTGNSYAMVEINWTCMSTSATVDQYFQMSMDSQIIFNARAEDDESATSQSPIKVLIPPFTKVEVKVGDAAANDMSVILAGRVYA